MPSTFILPVLAMVVAAVVYGWRHTGEATLDQKIATLTASALPPTYDVEEPTSTAADGNALLEQLAGPIFALAEHHGSKKRHLALDGLDEKIATLSVSELKALMQQDPDLTCANSRFLAKTPMPAWVEANIVWLAVERLFHLAPLEALQAVENAGAAQEGEDASIDLHNLIWRALGSWSERDMEAAWAWISARQETLYMGELKRNLMLEAHATHDFDGAIAMADRQGILEDALSYIGRSLATEEDMIAYLDASGRAKPGRGVSKRYAAEMIVEKVHNTSGFGAAHTFLAEHANDEPWTESLVEKVATTHLQEAPAEKAAWLVERLPTAQHPRVLRTLIQRWATLDLPAAAQWLGQQTAPWKADVVDALVKTIEPVDPEAAMAWQASLAEP